MPSGLVLDLIFLHETQSVVIVLCDIGNKSFFNLKLIKGSHHIPFKCERSSIRGEIRDEKQQERLFENDNEILLERWPNGSLKSNLIHSLDSYYENAVLAEILIGESVGGSGYI